MAKIKFHIPGMLADCCDGQSSFEVEASSLRQAIESSMSRFPVLRRHVFDDTGHQRRHVLIFLNDENISYLSEPDPKLTDACEISVVQAISGG